MIGAVPHYSSGKRMKMDIMIAGAGTVGFTLAQLLSHKHNVVVVDEEIETLNRLEEKIDILTLQGNIEDPKTFQRLHTKHIDLFIAVTDSDEANLLSTLIADDVLMIRRKIIRLKNDYFSESSVLDKLKIDDAVFPDVLTARKVEALFNYPKANNVKHFGQPAHLQVSVRVQYDDGSEYTVRDLVSREVVVMGIERDKVFLLPEPSEVVRKSDLLYLFGKREVIEQIALKLDVKMPSSIKRVVIFGANPLAQKIAKTLLDKKLEIKMIEKSRTHCETASECLQDKVSIINAAYSDHHLFEEEGLNRADMIIAAGMDDEKNIVKCIEAREHGIEKVIAINNDKAYYDLMHKLGIIVVRGSKIGAYYTILEKIASSSVVLERHFCGGNAVLFMRRIGEGSALIGKSITSVIQETFLFILRDEAIYTDYEELALKEGDNIIVSGRTYQEEKIQQWIYSL
jgi:trk system potassium uptake protein TrkA